MVSEFKSIRSWEKLKRFTESVNLEVRLDEVNELIVISKDGEILCKLETMHAVCAFLHGFTLKELFKK